jgi:hypothetical protein
VIQDAFDTALQAQPEAIVTATDRSLPYGEKAGGAGMADALHAAAADVDGDVGDELPPHPVNSREVIARTGMKRQAAFVIGETPLPANAATAAAAAHAA